MKDAADTRQQTVGGTTMFHGEPRDPFVIDERDTVDRFFPKVVRLTLPDHTQRIFQPGFQSVPRALADHDWLKVNGVVEMRSTSPLPPMMLSAPPGSQAHAATLHASGVYDATLIPDSRVTDAGVRAAVAVARMAAENVRVIRENLARAEEIMVSAAKAADDAGARAHAQRVGSEPEEFDDGPSWGNKIDGETDNQKKVRLAAEADADRAARVEKLTPKMLEEYNQLTTDQDRDAYLNSKGR